MLPDYYAEKEVGEKGGLTGCGIQEVSHMLIIECHHFNDYIALTPVQENRNTLKYHSSNRKEI